MGKVSGSCLVIHLKSTALPLPVTMSFDFQTQSQPSTETPCLTFENHLPESSPSSCMSEADRMQVTSTQETRTIVIDLLRASHYGCGALRSFAGV